MHHERPRRPRSGLGWDPAETPRAHQSVWRRPLRAVAGVWQHGRPDEEVGRIKLEVVAIMMDVRAAGTRAMISAFAAADLQPMLQITAPTLLLYGALDKRAPLAVAEDLHRRIPGSELRVIPGVGHGSNVAAPAEFNGEVRRFFRSVTP